MELRYYQREAIDACYAYFANNQMRNPCIVLPTGAGKTHLIVQVCRDVQKWQGRVLVVAHVKELLEQAASKLRAVDGLDVGVYSAALKQRDTESDVIVAGVQSIYKRGFELAGSRPFNVVIVDEAHRIPVEGDGMYVQLLNDLKQTNPRLRVIGLTATPYRTADGYVCSDDHFLNDVCFDVSIKELIAGKYLCPLSSKRSQNEVDMSGVKISNGDFAQSDMESRFTGDDKVGPAVAEILKLTADRRKVLIFCCGIGHASEVAFHLDAANQKVRVVSSQHDERDKSIDAFRNGDCKYLVNVNVLTEGFDATTIDSVVLLRATVSPGLYYQMVGRGLRIDPSKENCLVLDFGGNIKRHGTIDNLKIKKKTVGEAGEAPVKECPQCHEMIYAGLLTCTACGYEFPPPPPNHDSTASDDSPIAEVKIEEYDVTDVTYQVHTKRNAPDAPKTMRVSYWQGVNSICDEWVCVEHTGFAFEKAFAWWYARSKEQMPKTAEQAVALAKRGVLAVPSAIKVRTKTGERFATIVGYTLGSKPEVVEREPGDDGEESRDDSLWEEYLGSELPF